MIILKKNSLAKFYILLAVTLIMASCNTSTHTRSSKYSSANKRQSRVYVSKEKKAYPTAKPKSKKTYAPSDLSSDRRQSIVQYALQYEGTKYRYGGKSPDTGFDCSGFTGYVFTQNGIPVSGPSQQLAQMGKPKIMEQLMPGDLVFFGDKKKISHVGIVAERSKNEIQVVHATTSAGVKVDEISNSDYWSSRFLYGRDILSK